MSVVLGVPAIVQHNGSSGIPAAELRPSANVIVINRALPKLRCPLYVYRYLLFHERLHQIYPPTPGGRSIRRISGTMRCAHSIA